MEAAVPHNPSVVPLRATALKPSCVPHSDSCVDLHTPLCRYCWGSESDEDFVAPCACTGTQQHVHYRCLVRWVAAGLASRKQAGPLGHCEICKARFFGSTSHHALLLETAGTELQLTRMYSAARQGALAAALAAPQPLSRSLDAWLAAYWRLALRPLQWGMAAHAVLSVLPPERGGAAAAGAALVAQGASFFAGRMCEHWLRAYTAMGRHGSAALACLMFLSGFGSSLQGWLASGLPVGNAAFFLRLPVSLPFLPRVATALAAAGCLLPGRHASADGMRAAAMVPVLALKALLAAASGQRGWLHGLCKLIMGACGHLRAFALPG